MHDDVCSGAQTQAKLPDECAALEASSKPFTFNKCSVCDSEVYLDLNTGNSSKFCKQHLEKLDLQFDSSEEEDMMSGATAYASIPLCAIDECDLPCYVDDNGKIHECCGYTHAMEHIRRQLVESK